ncbi:pentatricopeptide repeat-containing protein At1g31920 [Magnolia sinica]|uniref:pentatricopeptide repeat-containing protein At1g31920 n=1 Tax=Magnolia sinica TaxID=86752 RepID=UPI0026588A34|nr:pentatricopeptide repeat-containing protein At1g31920 [Magnolia sinica]
MFRASVIQQTNLFIAPESTANVSELKPKEQECFSLLQKCKSMDEFKQAHARTIKLGLERDARAAHELITACALSAWGSMDYARLIFDQINDPLPFDFNTMMRGYIDDSDPITALLLYKEMQERGAKPDAFTYPPLLRGCALLSALREGTQIHGHVFKFGFESDLFTQNSLINMYGKRGQIEHSSKVFDQMRHRSVASWSALIAAYARLGFWDECLGLFGTMSSEGWRADESTLVNVLCSCGHLGALDLGRSTHGFLMKTIYGHNVIAETSLIDMYIKCGRLTKGLSLFESMPKKNIVTYSVMISGLAMHGEGRMALQLFSDMITEGIKPDNVVYVGVLSACSHAGLIDEGLQCFDRLRFEHRITPTIQHYGCMVDLLGRAGMLDQAHELIRSMPMEPNDVVWRCLLSACKVHNNLELAESTSRHLFQLDPHNGGDYVLLSNIYARSLRWDAVAKIWTDMVRRGAVQTPGFSMVEVRRKLHRFVSQDMSHPKSYEVYEMLHQIGWQLRFEGYCPDTSQVLFDVDEEEKKRLLYGHSQKLAIAFALISTSQGSPIRVVKNLRMCNDCHDVTKMISKIFKREISVRDRNRFHHFRDGRCSCGDYW